MTRKNITNNRWQNLLKHFTSLKGLSHVLQTPKGENIACPPSSPRRNVVPLFELTYRNIPTLNKEVWIALFSEVALFEYNVSTILLLIVASKTIIL